jgi:hypothetical protein
VKKRGWEQATLLPAITIRFGGKEIGQDKISFFS